MRAQREKEVGFRDKKEEIDTRRERLCSFLEGFFSVEEGRRQKDLLQDLPPCYMLALSIFHGFFYTKL